MKELQQILTTFDDWLWGNWLLFVLLGVGLLYTIITGGIQIRRFGYIIRKTVWEPIRSSGRAVWRRSKSWFPKMTKPPNSREIPGNSTATYIRRHRCLACLAPIASR